MQENLSSNNRLAVEASQVPNQNQNNPSNNQGSRRGRHANIDSSLFRVGITEENISYIEDHKILFLAGKVAVVDPNE